MSDHGVTQAVILAGGRGSRLRPLTDTMPKPMIAFHGRPFLAYLLEQLSAQGVQRAVLLIGYLAEQIRDYVGDGSRFGLRVDYVLSPVEAETGQRLRDAAALLDPAFLLLYGDNYWPMQWERSWRAFAEGGSPALITVYANRDGYTRNNVAVDEAGLVTAYDPSRSATGLNGVEIGYALLSRAVLEQLPEGNVSFERTVYPALVSRRLLRALVTHHRYYSVGSHERLPLTEAFLAGQRAVILDRDGVLNVRPPRAEYVRRWAQWQWLPGAREALRLFKEAGYRVIVVSNQAGVARGAMTERDLAEIHERMAREAREAGGEIDAVYHCPHGWDEGCACRKPRPGMLFQAQRDFHLDLTRTAFIGDDERDGQAAEAAGCPSILLTGGRTLLDAAQELLAESASWHHAS